MSSRLNDLDELVLQCRGEQAKSYVNEAVLCYKAGAFKASIVATWVAVTYDLIAKFKDLSLTGDKEAEKQIDRFEKARRNENISQALAIEREILTLAKDKFELISVVELTDLKRLQEDRNRCAHPSMVSSEEPYQPSAELARYHLHNAVEYLLKQQPVQGKAALERLKKDINSEYFPTKVDEALKHLSHGPLAKPRKSLVRNFVVILLKRMIYQNLEYKEMARYGAALNATRKMHRDATEKVLTNKLSDFIRTLKDEDLDRIVELLSKVGDVWHFFEKDVQELTKRYIGKLKGTKLSTLTEIITIDELQEVVIDRISRLSKDDVFVDLFLEYHPLIHDRRIQIYSKSANYHVANDLGEEIVMYVSDFNEDQVDKLFESAANNSQISGSFQFDSIINKIRTKNPISDKKLVELIEKHDLKRYIDDRYIPHLSNN